MDAAVDFHSDARSSPRHRSIRRRTGSRRSPSSCAVYRHRCPDGGHRCRARRQICGRRTPAVRASGQSGTTLLVRAAEALLPDHPGFQLRQGYEIQTSALYSGAVEVRAARAGRRQDVALPIGGVGAGRGDLRWRRAEGQRHVAVAVRSRPGGSGGQGADHRRRGRSRPRGRRAQRRRQHGTSGPRDLGLRRWHRRHGDDGQPSLHLQRHVRRRRDRARHGRRHRSRHQDRDDHESGPNTRRGRPRQRRGRRRADPRQRCVHRPQRDDP